MAIDGPRVYFHMTATKSYLRRAVEDLGAEVIGRPDLSTAEALAAIDADPRDYFTVGQCDNELPNGRCGEHTEPIAR